MDKYKLVNESQYRLDFEDLKASEKVTVQGCELDANELLEAFQVIMSYEFRSIVDARNDESYYVEATEKEMKAENPDVEKLARYARRSGYFCGQASIHQKYLVNEIGVERWYSALYLYDGITGHDTVNNW